jgi:hypothetical protein
MAAPAERSRDESTMAKVLESIMELPRAAIRNRQSSQNTLTLDVDTALGQSVVIATANPTYNEDAARPTIVLAWNSAYPMPFALTPSGNITYFDLKFGLSSLLLTKLAISLRDRLEAHGYKFTHFDESPSRNRSLFSRAKRYGRRKILSKLKDNAKE